MPLSVQLSATTVARCLYTNRYRTIMNCLISALNLKRNPGSNRFGHPKRIAYTLRLGEGSIAANRFAKNWSRKPQTYRYSASHRVRRLVTGAILQRSRILLRLAF